MKQTLKVKVRIVIIECFTCESYHAKVSVSGNVITYENYSPPSGGSAPIKAVNTLRLIIS